MIPLKLQIKNFLSYGSEIQTIEFGHYPLICLSGKNGHGKSALLDAITWALWGQARKLSGIAKADQGLLRLGQTQMMVCLDFECAGQQYRIKREYMQTYGKPVAIVEFGLYDSAQDRFVPLTDKTIRDTQHKIDQTLHLTYDAFINSAFLRQGQANEFSKKSPKERKEVLGAILGLDQYENIRRLASERIKQTTTYKLHISTLNEKLAQELTHAPLISQKLIEVSQKQNEIATQEQQLSAAKQLFEKDTATLQDKKQELAMHVYKQQQLAQEQHTLQQQLRQLFFQWRSIHKQRLQNIDYAQLENQKKELVDTIKNHQKILQEQLQLKQELLNHKETVARISQEFHEKKSLEINTKKIAIERLHAEKNHLQNTIKENLVNQKRTQDMLENYQRELTELAKLQEQQQTSHFLNALEKQFEKRKEYYQRWIAHANMISAELNALDQKNKLVHDEDSPSCPLCEQNLSASRKRFLKNKFEDDIVFLKQRFTRLSTLIKKLKIILLGQHAQLEQIKKQAQEQQLLIIKIEECNKTIITYQTQTADISGTLHKHQELDAIVTATIQKEIAALQQLERDTNQELTKVPAYLDIQKKLKTLEENLVLLGYNQSAHETAMALLADVEKRLELHQQVLEQQVLQTQRSQNIATLCAQLKKIKRQLVALDMQLSIKATLEAEEQVLINRKNTLEKSLHELIQNKNVLLHEKGSLENQKEKLEQVQQEYTLQQKELTSCNATIDDYQAIAQATGKDGIQALLIEDAIPEIEHEANELLAKLTDNQTQLFIESLRDLKKGGTKETLDIKISDAIGIRAYELFSGGEAFRIDFALRIAISKLLARRAGTSLQTLIIDEGFGSQDEDGLSNIMDALYKIQDDFAKIIIVSHLSSMKNQFPVHFVIEKGPNGSIVHVMEQG